MGSSLSGAVIADWVSLTQNAEFGNRELFGITFHSSSYFLIGGNDGTAKNDVWRSPNGYSWTQATANSGMGLGGSYYAVSFDGSMFVLDGSGDINKSDNDYGTAWTEVADKDWSNEAPLLVFDDKLWSFQINKNVYSSTDGATWTAVTQNAEVDPNSGYLFFNYNSKMWIVSGNIGDEATTNAVWSTTDGIEWTAVTRNANFTARHSAQGFVWDSKMWVVGGRDGSNDALKDVWYSTDGETWTENGDANFSARYDGRGYSDTTTNIAIIIGGYDDTPAYFKDVWYAVEASNTPTPSPTDAVATYTITPTWTNSFTETITETHTETFTPTVTPTITQTNTIIPTSSATETQTQTHTNTFTFTVTLTASHTFTVTQTVTPATYTHTPTNTPVYSPTSTPTITPTWTLTETPTVGIVYIVSKVDGHPDTMKVMWSKYEGATYRLGIGEQIIELNNDSDLNPEYTLGFTYILPSLAWGTSYAVRVTINALEINYASNVLNITVGGTATPTPVWIDPSP